MSEQIDKLGLDASQYIDEVGRMTNVINSNTQRLKDMAASLGAVSEGLGAVRVNISDVDDEGNKIRATLKRVADGWDIVNTSVSVNIAKMREQAQVVSLASQASDEFVNRVQRLSGLSTFAIRNMVDSSTKKYQEFFRFLDANAERMAGISSVVNRAAGTGQSGTELASISTVRGGGGVRANALNLETIAQNQLNITNERAARLATERAAAERLLDVAIENIIVDTHREQQAIDADNAAFQRFLATEAQMIRSSTALAAARDRGTEAAIRERNATQVGQALGARFTNADPAASARSLSTITGLIQKGQIEAQRVLQIVNSVQNGTREVFTGVEQRVASAARTLTSTNRQVGQSFRQVGEEGERAARGINLSWQSVVRIFLVQSLHTAIGQFIAQLRVATESASQFEIKISEIRTISQDNQLSFAQWSSEARRLSDEFGNPILDVASGLYETISNQVAKGADSALFMAKAMAFARTTVATTAESVDLLSAVINSYHLSVGDADRVSAVLFKTIDLGRVRASELANTFGRVAGLAAPLGVSLEEVSAAIATLTINGIKYNEAYTLVNNVLLKLLRPTEAMKKLLQEWGFASGEAAISALGFSGVLQKLEVTTGGSAEEIGELFNQIRGVRGVLGLTGSAFKTFEQDLAKIRDSSAQYQAAQVIAAESAGRIFQVEINRIKNFFISDFGEPFINFIATIGRTTDPAGRRLSGFSDTLRTLISYVTTAGEVFIAYRIIQTAVAIQETIAMNVARAHTAIMATEAASASTLNASMLALRFSFAGLINPITLVTAAVGLMIFEWNQQREAAANAARFAEEAAARLSEIVADQTKEFNANIDKQTQHYSDSLRDRLKLTFENVAKIRKLDDELIARQIENREQVQKRTKDIFDLSIKAVEEGIHKLDSIASTAVSNVAGALDRIRDLREGLQHTQFERKLSGLDPAAQIAERRKQIDELNRIASQRLGKASTAAEGKDALKQATQEQNEADRLSNDLLKERADAAKKLAEVQTRIKELEAKQPAKEQSRADREALEALERTHKLTKQQSQELKDRRAALRDTKEGHTDAEQDRRTAEELSKLKIQEAEQEKILKTLGATKDLEKQISDQVSKRIRDLDDYEKKQKAIADAAEKAKKAEQDRLETLRTLVVELGKIKLPKEVKDDKDKQKTLDQFDATTGRIKAAGGSPELLLQLAKERKEIEREADLEIQKHRLDSDNETLQKQKEQAIRNAEDVANRIKKINDTRTEGLEKIKLLGQEFQEFAKAHKGDISPDEVKLVLDAVNNFASSQTAANLKQVNEAMRIIGSARGGGIIKEPDAAGAGGRTTQTLINDIAVSLKKILTAPAELKQAQADQAALDDQAKKLNLQTANTAATIATVGDSFIVQVKKQTIAFQNLEASINAAASRINTLGAGIPTHALGGQSLARGTDTVMAMLSPGEFVVNAAATRKYLPSLKAMNSLSYLSNGGYISPQRNTNYSITSGDTNHFSFAVHAHANDRGQVDVDDLARQLMRKVRNRTVDFSSRR